MSTHNTIHQWLDKSLRRRSFDSKYPGYMRLIQSFQVVHDATIPVAAIEPITRPSDPWTGRYRLRLNLRYFGGLSAPLSPFDHPDRMRYLPGILIHECNHVLFDHCHPVEAQINERIYRLAQELAANEFIVEPLPGNPPGPHHYCDFGVRGGQSTEERYALLLRASRHHSYFEHFLTHDVHLHRKPERWERVDQPALGRNAAAGVQSDLLEVLSELEDGEVQTDWRSALRQFARNLRRPQRTWKRINRRHPEPIGRAPGKRRADDAGNPRLLVAIDTSGSISTEMLQEFAAELREISRHAVKITVVEIDDRVRRIYRFTGRLTDVRGRGGTDLRPVFEESLRKRVGRIDAIVYMTDGCGPYPAESAVPTLWLLNTPPEKFDCPFGEKVALAASTNDAAPIRP